MAVKHIVQVHTPSRLHFGLVNTSAGGARIDGGAGLMIERPSITVTIQRAASLSVLPARMYDDVRVCMRALGVGDDLRFRVEISDDIPDHCGLGWRTQLRLAIGCALAAMLDVAVDQSTLPGLLGRGGTSGLGSWGFWSGGFLVDGGHSRSSKSRSVPSSAVKSPELPPLRFQADFPWRVVVALHDDDRLVFGETEKELFRQHTPTPYEESVELEGLVYEAMVKAVSTEDFIAFTETMDRASLLGFNRVESAFRGSAFGDCVTALREAGLSGVSMSSWGPTYFGFAPDLAVADTALRALRSRGDFKLVLAPPVSAGATVSVDGSASIPAAKAVLA